MRKRIMLKIILNTVVRIEYRNIIMYIRIEIIPTVKNSKKIPENITKSHKRASSHENVHTVAYIGSF